MCTAVAQDVTHGTAAAAQVVHTVAVVQDAGIAAAQVVDNPADAQAVDNPGYAQAVGNPAVVQAVDNAAVAQAVGTAAVVAQAVGTAVAQGVGTAAVVAQAVGTAVDQAVSGGVLTSHTHIGLCADFDWTSNRAVVQVVGAYDDRDADGQTVYAIAVHLEWMC